MFLGILGWASSRGTSEGSLVVVAVWNGTGVRIVLGSERATCLALAIRVGQRPRGL